MTPDTARMLARKLADTFPDGHWTHGVITGWAEDFETLDEAKAGTTIARLRRTWQAKNGAKAPNLPEFMQVYRTINTDGPAEGCTSCAGSGWVHSLEDGLSCDVPNPVPVSVVRPCTCPLGRQQQSVFDGIRQTNRR